MHVVIPNAIFVNGSLVSGMAVSMDERIVDIFPVSQAPEDAEYLPGLLLPGLVNAHSHAFQRGLRGHVQWAPGEDSFWAWREQMYKLAVTLSPEGIEAISALAYLEMIHAGFTTVGEFHYLQHQPDGQPYDQPDELALRVAAAAQSVGIRQVLLRVAYARAGFELPPNPRQARFYDKGPEDVLVAVERLRQQGLTVGIAPHSIRAAPMDWLKAFADFKGPIHAHVDEQPAEIAASLKEYGLRPLQVLAEAGLVDERLTAVHFTHADAAEIALLRQSQGRICACPTTELDLGDGFLPAEQMMGLPLCIGTDSHALIDPFTELRSLEWHTRARTGRRSVMQPHDQPDALAAMLWQVGSREGARSLQIEAGEIAVGQLADLICVDLNRPELIGARALPGLVFGAGPACVRESWVGGKRVMKNGYVPGEERILQNARKALSF